ncbi:MAG TPA: GIY-YIG nuclease family protein [Leucothrix mucor]|nr:GIY-YIG nuclease family protein [Leucothrix mucor]
MKNKESKKWFVYIVRCADDSLYTGITTDVSRREAEHNNDKLGAKYTRARRPVSVVYQESWESRSEATKREIEIKKMKKVSKEKLLESNK